ncbi:MAG: site-specific integrase [PVC group bacterium]|nr:site-specific integrase [PVC group bacterium]
MGYLFKRGNKWAISFKDDRGQWKRKTVSRFKEAALRSLKQMEIDVADGRYRKQIENPPMKFKDFADKFLNLYIRLENKNPRDQQNLLNCVTAHFGNKLLDEVNDLMIRRYLREKQKTCRPSTVNKHLTLLKSMFNRAREWRIYQGENPTRGIKKFDENNERVRCLDADDQQRLVECCNGLAKMVVIVALGTGLRYSEIINLKRLHESNSNFVDFDNNLIYVHSAMCKSGKSRHVPMSKTVRDSLLSIPKQKGTPYFFFNTKTGKPIGSIKTAFNKAVKRAEIIDFKFHDLRHTFASNLVRMGIDIYVVQQLLGHSSMKMTQRYAHLRPDQLHDAIAKLDLQFGNFDYNTHSQLHNSGTLGFDTQNSKNSKIAKAI